MINFLFTVAMLAVMEVSLSFDNAVVNASVLKRMNERWQQIFLSWGLLVSVFAVRLIAPAVIVSISTATSIPSLIEMAVHNPTLYAAKVIGAHKIIAGFGGTFLLLVFSFFLCDNDKDTHWVWGVERLVASSAWWLIAFGAIIILTGIMCGAPFIPMLLALLLFGLMEFLEGRLPQDVALSGFIGFLYLELLDASFSLDGIVGAFAISSDIVAIMIGLGIGSFCIRSMTVYMVRKRSLEAFKYLEHGAHWSIGALGFLLLLSCRYDISQTLTGLLGVIFIGLAVVTSIYRKKEYADY